jgi:hypothetical protein
MFNPDPQIQHMQIDRTHACHVLDAALLDPQAWVRVACAQRSSFAESPHNAYPGPELELPEGITARIDDYFAQHFRRLLGARRIERSHSRLSLATWPAERLQPRQWICHRDRMDSTAGQLIAASVLYLFQNPELGGTSFFRPRRSEAETARLVHDSGVLDAAQFQERYGIQPAYLTDSNDWFERVLTVPARYNRLIVYDGCLFHGADLRRPELLDPDPERGRLTWNGFFTCTRKAI